MSCIINILNLQHISKYNGNGNNKSKNTFNIREDIMLYSFM